MHTGCGLTWLHITQRMQSLSVELRTSVNALRQQEHATHESMRRDEVVRQQLDELRYCVKQACPATTILFMYPDCTYMDLKHLQKRENGTISLFRLKPHTKLTIRITARTVPWRYACIITPIACFSALNACVFFHVCL